jgi:hypothetical protein
MEKNGILSKQPPFETIGGFTVTPSGIKALKFSLERERALASLIFL